MDCCQCSGIESQFDRREAEGKLREYRRKGPADSTRILLEALLAEGVAGATLLDIGGGIGAIPHALLEAGLRHATDVDASSAYLAIARAETDRQGHADRASFRHGNFVDLADEIAPADIVTLDRVVCCYHEMPALVGRSSAKARRLYGLVYPRDVWWVRAGAALINLLRRLRRTSFRAYVHSPAAIDAVLRRQRLERQTLRRTIIWEVATYRR